jgi:predicted acetyltransferase
MDVRTVSGDALLESAAPLRAYAFQPSPRPVDAEALRRRLPYGVDNRVLVAFDGARPVATATLLPGTQCVRGAVLPMAGIGAVAVHPGARRRGLARRLVGDLLAHAERSGDAVSCLYPFRESFYGRLGWVTVPQLRVARLDPRNLTPLLPLDLPGTVDLLPIGEGLADYRAFLARQQGSTHGMCLRTETAAGALAETNQWLALVRDGAGTVVGGMQYEILNWRGELRSEAFFAATAPARYHLLRWLAQHADQVATASLMLPADALIENWLADIEVLAGTRTDFVTPMVRVLSVPGLAGIQAGTGEVTVAVQDPFCPWNEGTWALAAGDNVLAVSRAAGDPEATLTAQGLSALVYGGYDPAELPLRGWGDPDEATRARLRALLPPPATLPYLYEEF